jgi:acyl transferase domain-containing protein
MDESNAEPGSQNARGDLVAAHVAMFTFEVALYELWRSWGVSAATHAGQGIGEYVIAWASGIMSLEDACRLVAQRARVLTTAHHDPKAQAAIKTFERLARETTFNAPTLAIIPSSAGDLDASRMADSTYWIRQLKQPASAADLLRALVAHGCELVLPMGPDADIVAVGRQLLTTPRTILLPGIRSARDAWQNVLEALAALYVRGTDVDWAGFDRAYQRRRLALPTYPFQRQRYWYDVDLSKPTDGLEQPAHPAQNTRYDIDNLSEEEAEAMLVSQLDELGY